MFVLLFVFYFLCTLMKQLIFSVFLTISPTQRDWLSNINNRKFGVCVKWSLWLFTGHYNPPQPLSLIREGDRQQKRRDPFHADRYVHTYLSLLIYFWFSLFFYAPSLPLYSLSYQSIIRCKLFRLVVLVNSLNWFLR